MFVSMRTAQGFKIAVDIASVTEFMDETHEDGPRCTVTDTGGNKHTVQMSFDTIVDALNMAHASGHADAKLIKAEGFDKKPEVKLERVGPQPIIPGSNGQFGYVPPADNALINGVGPTGGGLPLAIPVDDVETQKRFPDATVVPVLASEPPKGIAGGYVLPESAREPQALSLADAQTPSIVKGLQKADEAKEEAKTEVVEAKADEKATTLLASDDDDGLDILDTKSPKSTKKK